jgi:hypothetical protein
MLLDVHRLCFLQLDNTVSSVLWFESGNVSIRLLYLLISLDTDGNRTRSRIIIKCDSNANVKLEHERAHPYPGERMRMLIETGSLTTT